MNMTLIYGAIAGAVAYMLSKPSNAPIENNTPTGNTIPDGTVNVTPTITLPDPSTVVNPNPVVNVDPINNTIPVIIPAPNSGSFPDQLPGNVIFQEDYSGIPLGAVTLNIYGTGGLIVSPTLQGLRNKGWDYTGSDYESDGNPTIAIIQDPTGQFNAIMRMRYTEFEDPNLGYQGYALPEWQHAKLYRHFNGKTEIWERYYVRYSPINPSKPFGFGSVAAKQHYWRQGDTGIPQGGKQTDFCSNYWWGIPNLVMGWQCCDLSGSQDNIAYPNGAQTVYHGGGNIILQSVNMLDQQWHLVETHIKEPNTVQANGMAEVFVDGIQTQGVYGIGDSGHGITPQMYIDNIHQYRQGSENLFRDEAIWEASGI